VTRRGAALQHDWERLVTFYAFPQAHGKHLRTTNVVESPFAAVRLRTTAAKRFQQVGNATALIWRVLRVAEQRFRRLDAPDLLAAVSAGRVREASPAYNPMRVVVSFGPEHAPLEQRQVQRAWEEAQQLFPKPKLLVFATFQFDPEAAKDMDEMKPELAGMQFLKVQMNADLLTEDLKKKRASNESFWLIGQPDVRVERIAKGEDKGKLRVSVHGFDYYNTKSGAIESGGEERIAVWLLDTDYDGRSLYPRQVSFPMAGEKDGWARLAKNLKAEIDEELIEAYRGTVSLPFAPGEHQRIAVKIVDDRGIESLKVLET